MDIQDLNIIYDFGFQPRCFDYTKDINEDTPLYNFVLTQSTKTGCLKLKLPIPAKSLKHRYKWIINKEPDKHLYLISDRIIKDSKTKNTKVLFLSEFDRIVFDSVHSLHNIDSIMVDPKADLSIEHDNINQALILDEFNNDNVSHLIKKYGTFDIIVCCRLLEHCDDLNKFINLLNNLLAVDGSIIFEVPDSTKSLLQGDIAMLWEEHICYFTPESLRLELDSLGYILKDYIIYRYPQEDAIIGTFNRSNTSNNNKINNIIPSGEAAINHIYRNKLLYLISEINKYLTKLKRTYGNIIIFGAGHRTIMFINLLGISEYILFVVDDDENKIKLKLPISNLEIKHSNEIMNHDVGVCLLSININSENKVINLLNSKTDKPIQYYSISPDSELHLPILGLF